MSAIQNFDDLVAEVDFYLKSSSVTPRIPRLIATAENALRRRLAEAGAARATATASPSGPRVALPPDFGGLVDLKVPGAPHPVEQVGYQHLRLMPERTGPTELFAISGAELHFWPTAPGSVSITYFRTLPPLAASPASAATNWLLARAPDAYLFGALVESEAFNMNDERMPVWKARLEEVVGDLTRDDARREWGSGPLVCRRVS